MTEARLQLGAQAEALAAEYLEKKGYRILERNWRTRLGELDLIALIGDRYVFVEVKAGRDSGAFSPIHHLDPRKQRKLLTLGRAYLARFREPVAARFDLITVVSSGKNFRIEHFENVLEDERGL